MVDNTNEFRGTFTNRSGRLASSWSLRGRQPSDDNPVVDVEPVRSSFHGMFDTARKWFNELEFGGLFAISARERQVELDEEVIAEIREIVSSTDGAELPMVFDTAIHNISTGDIRGAIETALNSLPSEPSQDELNQATLLLVSELGAEEPDFEVQAGISDVLSRLSQKRDNTADVSQGRTLRQREERKKRSQDGGTSPEVS